MKEKISITYKDVAYILDSLNFDSLKNISDNAKYFRIYKFLIKNFYVKRKRDTCKSNSSEKATNLAIHFLKECFKLRTKNYYDLDCILNCGEQLLVISLTFYCF